MSAEVFISSSRRRSINQTYHISVERSIDSDLASETFITNLSQRPWNSANRSQQSRGSHARSGQKVGTIFRGMVIRGCCYKPFQMSHYWGSQETSTSCKRPRQLEPFMRSANPADLISISPPRYSANLIS